MEKVNLPINVYAIYDYAREIKPVRFSIIGNDNQESIKVERVIRRDKEKIEGVYITTFTCEVVSENGRKLYDLRFNHETGDWIIYRM